MSNHLCWSFVLVIGGLLGHTLCAPVEDIGDVSLEKLSNLKNQLKALEKNIDTFVETKHGVQKRQLVEPLEDTKLASFVQSLSPEDIVLLKHMKSKVQYLQAVLDEPDTGPNPGEEPEPLEKRRTISDSMPLDQDDVLTEFMAHLSGDGLKLLKKNQNRLKYLQAALHAPAGQINPGDETVFNDKRDEVPQEEPLPMHPMVDEVKHAAPATQKGNNQKVAAQANQKTQVDFTEADREMLHEIGSKLDQLQTELEFFKKMELLKSKMEELEMGDGKLKQVHEDGTFGSFVTHEKQRKELNDSMWYDRPLLDSEIENAVQVTGTDKSSRSISPQAGTFGSFVREVRDFASVWYNTSLSDSDLEADTEIKRCSGAECNNPQEIKRCSGAECNNPQDTKEAKRQFDDTVSTNDNVDLMKLLQVLNKMSANARTKRRVHDQNMNSIAA